MDKHHFSFCIWLPLFPEEEDEETSNVKWHRFGQRWSFFNLAIEILTSCNHALIHGNFFFSLISTLDKLKLDPYISAPFTKWSLVSNFLQF
jgi:hypothetical protein